MMMHKEQQMQYDETNSKIHRYQKRLLNEYGCDLEIDDCFKLEKLRREYIKTKIILFRFTKGNNKSYSDYIGKCNAIIKEAFSLGLVIHNEPVRKLKDIKIELIKLLGLGGLTTTSDINQLLIAMKLVDEIDDENNQDITSTKARLPINEKQRIAEVKAYKDKQLEQSDDWDDWVLQSDDFNIYDESGKVIGKYPEDYYENMQKEHEQYIIDEYNKQL